MDDVSVGVILLAFFVIFGIGSSLVYYFARYYFRTHEKDIELAPDIKEKLKASEPDFTEQLKAPEVDSETTYAPETAKISAPDKISQRAPETEPSMAVSKKPVEPPVKKKELREALLNTKQGLFGRIKQAIGSQPNIEEDDLEYLEEILYTSDLGPQTVQRLVESVGESLSTADKANLDKVRTALKNEMLSIFEELSSPAEKIKLIENHSKPTVIMVVGVNGVGKTTTIGKLAHYYSQNNLKTMVVAGDTFRAAAREQLQVWSDRANVEIFDPGNVQDPSAVAFDGCSSAKAQEFDVVIIDTAGRLHTQDNLMEELKKMKRVVQKVLPNAPHESIIVLDANSGQNALVQAKTFNEAIALSGAILTKLDGTAKGGVAVGLACELHIPIRLIGVGEGVEDLRPFDSKEFVDSII